MGFSNLVAKNLLPIEDPKRESLLKGIEAYLKPFRCYLMACQLDEGFHAVDVSSGNVLSTITNVEAFARANGIAPKA